MEAPTAHKERIINRILEQASKEDLFSEDELRIVKASLDKLPLDELVGDYLPSWYGELWKWKPVPVEEWLYSEEHMNLRGQIYPRLAEDFIELFEGGYREAVIEGSIGWGKSFFAGLALTRMIYEISCYKNPQLAFSNIADNSQIVLVNIATKLEVAKEVVFGYVKGFVHRSPYFKRHFPMDKDLTKELRFPGNIRVMPAASTQGSVLGQNIYGGVLDEANFLFKGESERAGSINDEYDLAKVLWQALIRRIKSRFGEKHPGLLLNVSSSMYPDDFTKWRKDEADKVGEKIFYRRYSQWETKPAYQEFDKDPKEYFWLSIGDSGHRPRILKKEGDDGYDPELDDIETLQDLELKVIKVPNDFRLEFERDIDMAIRDIAGYATLSKHPFIRDVQPILRSFERAKKRKVKHPWTVETTTLLDGSTWIKNNLDFTKRLNHHFAHVDLALTQDAAGLCVVRLDGIEEKKIEIPYYDDIEGELRFRTDTHYVPKITTVLQLQVKSTQEREIPVAKLRQIILDLISWGFLFSFVSYDQYQSAESLQAFRQMGVEADKVSVDRKMDPYNSLKEAYDEDRIDDYEYPVFLKEITALERDLEKGKVDHPPKGSKDVSDAKAGAVFNCTEFVRENPGVVVKGDLHDDPQEPMPVFFGEEERPVDFDVNKWLLS